MFNYHKDWPKAYCVAYSPFLKYFCYKIKKIKVRVRSIRNANSSSLEKKYTIFEKYKFLQ